jgi:HPt (histidine-containing phosphotransfer) domain-containing protein
LHPVGARPGVAARILAIADAYDAMTSDAAYRKRRTRGQAFAELRRCSGTQFDPELVERFISAVRFQSDQSPAMLSISTDSALDIGLQIEQLVMALDDQDITALRRIADRILATAGRCGIEALTETAGQLQAALADGSDMIEVMQCANDLLDLCRMSQSALIRDVWHMHDHVPTTTASAAEADGVPHGVLTV